MAHTPGPWIWSGDQLLAKRVMHSEPVLIATGEPFTPGAEDKALIASAPDMLAALSHVRRWLGTDLFSLNDTHHGRCEESIKLIDAAVARATQP